MSILSLLVGISSFFTPTIYTVEAFEEPPPPKVVLIEIKETIPPILKSIADCESGTRDKDGRAVGGSATHYDTDGSVLLGKHTDPKYGVDIGKYQINSLYHTETAGEMGLDLYNEGDNEEYALFLYKQNGTRDWNSSKSCWE